MKNSPGTVSGLCPVGNCVVGLIAVRKDHSEPLHGAKSGDALQITLIQVMGECAPIPSRANPRPRSLTVDL